MYVELFHIATTVQVNMLIKVKLMTMNIQFHLVQNIMNIFFEFNNYLKN